MPRDSSAGWISPKTDSRAILRLFTSSWANLLLLCIPVGYVLGGIDANPNAVFVLVRGRWARRARRARARICSPQNLWCGPSTSERSGAPHAHTAEASPARPPTRGLLTRPAFCHRLQNFLSLLPLALILGEVTEDLAIRFGDAIGGLLNATFGNVVELILGGSTLTPNPNGLPGHRGCKCPRVAKRWRKGEGQHAQAGRAALGHARAPLVRSASAHPARGGAAPALAAIAALLKGLYTVVAASLIGSILSNLLLVLGEW